MTRYMREIPETVYLLVREYDDGKSKVMHYVFFDEFDALERLTFLGGKYPRNKYSVRTIDHIQLLDISKAWS